MKLGSILVLLLVALVLNPCMAEEKEYKWESKVLEMKLIPRSAEQMLAFYEGRGFPAKTFKPVSKACFFTVVVVNKTRDRLWLDLGLWKFSDGVKRLNRDYWKRQWEDLKLALAKRSTFGWTLLPELRGLYPDEGVGGNITLAAKQPFQLEAVFINGDKNKGSPHVVKMEKLKCR